MEKTISADQILNMSMLAIVSGCPKLHDALVELALTQELSISNFAQRQSTENPHLLRLQRQDSEHSARHGGNWSAAKLTTCLAQKCQKQPELHAWLAKSVQDIEGYVSQEHLPYLQQAMLAVSTAARQEIAAAHFCTECDNISYPPEDWTAT
jgi:hypothetical protein